MPVATDSSTMAEHIRLRGTRKPAPNFSSDPRHPHPHASIPSIVQPTSCKSTISSLLLSTFTTTCNPEGGSSSRTSNGAGHINDSKKKCFNNSGLWGLGCTAQPEASAPAPAALIRSSADWKEKGERKSEVKRKKKKKQKQKSDGGGFAGEMWCGPGIGFSGGFAGDDFVASTRRLSGRGKIDVDVNVNVALHQGEQPAYTSRRRANIETFSELDLDAAFEIPRFGSDVFEARYYHHLRNCSREGLSEITMCQNRVFMRARPYGFDRYQEMRLDTENMSYEELLELGDRIGYVSTGLKENEMGHCIRKTKLSSSDDNLSHLPTADGKKCSICQEEYEEDAEVGRLECGHMYHIQCIKQWLTIKRACPVCKAEASSN